MPLKRLLNRDPPTYRDSEEKVEGGPIPSYMFVNFRPELFLQFVIRCLTATTLFYHHQVKINLLK